MPMDALTASESESLKQIRLGNGLGHIPPKHIEKFRKLRLIKDKLEGPVLTLLGRAESHIIGRPLF